MLHRRLSPRPSPTPGRTGARISTVGLAAVTALSLAACTSSDQQSSGDPASSGGSSPSASATQSGTPSHGTAPSSPSGSDSADPEQPTATVPIQGTDAWTTTPWDRQSAPASEGLVFHDLRAAQHDGFTRVVVEFTGTGDPGWFMRWSDEPVEQGRGLPLEVQGTAFLDLAITGTSMPLTDEEEAQYYAGPNNVAAGGLDVVQNGTFEDQTHIVIGMSGQHEFQVGTLTDPVRVVIDVKD